MLQITKEDLEILKAAQMVLQRLGKEELNPHSSAYKVYELAKNAIDETMKGNGNMKIYITSDDEANSYHGLYYLLDTDKHDLDGDWAFDTLPSGENVALLG